MALSEGVMLNTEMPGVAGAAGLEASGPGVAIAQRPATGGSGHGSSGGSGPGAMGSPAVPDPAPAPAQALALAPALGADAAAAGTSAQKAGIEEEEDIERPCTKAYHSKSSRPGRPCVPAALTPPFREDTPWRSALGRRIFRAVTGHLTKEDCDGFELHGDSTWCMRAMRATDVLGLSYGIEERDLWSEKMSNYFHMPTRLYDCFIPPRLSPPIRGSAPNGTGDGSCSPNGPHCYETRYEAYRICLGPEAKKINGRRYETLLSHLADRGPLSTHVKIDVEGTEWPVLESLLESGWDQDKIRTLEMEVHFSFAPEGLNHEWKALSEQERLERAVTVMERLLQRFVVTGSTIEVYREDWHPEKECPDSNCPEPPVHIPSLQLNQFAVSYVHRNLLGPGFVERQPLAAAPATSAPAVPAVPDVPKAPNGVALPAPGELPTQPLAPDCEFECLPNCGGSARPGKPCIRPAKIWPYKTYTHWRSELGERILKAVEGTVSEEECGGFHLVGDHVFCKKAMQRQDALALSYGIEEGDLWSEMMSNIWHVPPRLYDCFQDPRTSPPMSGKAPNATGRGNCPRDGHCYEMPYQVFRVCLGPRKATLNGHKYEPLEEHLAGRGPLSTYLKIDVEGSEWRVLEQFLSSEANIARVRTLDMEVHFGYGAESDENKGIGVQRQVQVMERLLVHFKCSGTTLENYNMGWRPWENCPEQQCDEPAVHTLGGYGIGQFAVSYVNRKLL
uniref:Methyltransferase domain-containing protein n=1 Tax=Pyrodinium bahamense TaxID=73915 RepID=A0A7S0FK73_9DINO